MCMDTIRRICGGGGGSDWLFFFFFACQRGCHVRWISLLRGWKIDLKFWGTKKKWRGVGFILVKMYTSPTSLTSKQAHTHTTKKKSDPKGGVWTPLIPIFHSKGGVWTPHTHPSVRVCMKGKLIPIFHIVLVRAYIFVSELNIATIGLFSELTVGKPIMNSFFSSLSLAANKMGEGYPGWQRVNCSCLFVVETNLWKI